ncbi:MAG TPA: homoserine dehydrogenase [Candidatus Deferrimicrobiaceae bacterium]|nr:homoserine dehydrogenase [Candidatus Deferrimicrobiaceae bacterium]
MNPERKEIGVGIIGFGTVGTGTVKLLLDNAELLRRRIGIPIRLVQVADIDLERERDVSLPGEILTNDGFQVVRNQAVHIVVELVGGKGAAREFLLEAIRQGKSVVTANKALLAEHGEEISRAAAVAGVDLGFEASVGGGIPIIRVLREGLAANRINEIFGIINGTCNYILSRMTNEGKEFAEVLAEAQKIGLAEADPSFDVDGIDSAHKLAILVWLATGGRVPLADIFVEGIRDVSAQDITFAREFGYTIKLLAIAKQRGSGIEVHVHPTMIPSDHLLATVGGPFNAIYVKGDFVGSSLYYGQGAGKLPTASAVVSDVIEIARNLGKGISGRIPPSGFHNQLSGKGTPVSPFTEVDSEYYLRFLVVDKPGVLSKIAGILGAHQISISSVIQKGRKQESAVPIFIVTHHAKEKDMRAALEETDRLPVVLDRTRMIRIENNL